MSTTITMADVIIINTVLYNKTTSIDCESNRIESLPLRSFRWVGENRFVMVAKQQNRNKAKIQATVKSNVDRQCATTDDYYVFSDIQII